MLKLVIPCPGRRKHSNSIHGNIARPNILVAKSPIRRSLLTIKKTPARESVLDMLHLNTVEETCEINITLLTNYGDDKEIFFNRIEFLTEEFQTIFIESITFRNNAEKLSKTSEFPFWRGDWPPKAPMTSYTFTFKLRSDSVKCIKILPNIEKADKNVKDALIIFNKKVVFFGQFPKEMCEVIHLSNRNAIQSMEDPLIRGDVAIDVKKTLDWNQSILPCPYIIKIIPKNTYDNKTTFSLNHIMLFDDEGNQITKNIIIRSSFSENSYSMGFLVRKLERDTKKFIEESTVCVGGPFNENSFIEILIDKPCYIGCIALINPHETPGNLDVSTTKNMYLYFDNKKIWNGRIKRRNFIESDEKTNGTFVWFTDDKEYQNEVMNLMPSREFCE